MGKKKAIRTTITIILSCILACLLINAIIHRVIALELSRVGEYYFMNNQLAEYITSIETEEIDDISCEVHLSYQYRTDYDKATKTLNIRCTLDNYTSNKIDKYYTKRDNKEASELLTHIMDAIDRKIVDKKYTYNVTNVGTVIISVIRPSYGLTLTTDEGREYEYYYTRSGSLVTVEIDGDFVYFETNSSDPNDELRYVTGIRECSLGHCDSPPREGSKYCHRHGCCVLGCQIEKDPFAHCCYKHNCSHPGCAAHVYEYANSKYCQVHYDEH